MSVAPVVESMTARPARAGRLRAPKQRRRFVASALILVGVGTSVVSYRIGANLQSADELAAKREPPPPSLLTVPIVRQSIVQQFTARADVVASGSVPIEVQAAAGATRLVLTRAPLQAGALVENGSVVAEVSARPLIVLDGALPMFRNLRVGDEGDDVQQAEQSLAELGHDPGPVDGVYDMTTAAAVGAFYASIGYAPVTGKSVDPAAYSSLEVTVRALANEVTAAEAAVAESAAPPRTDEIAAADVTVAEAQAQLNEADRRVDAQRVLISSLEAQIRALPPDALATDPATVTQLKTTLQDSIAALPALVDTQWVAKLSLDSALAAREALVISAPDPTIVERRTQLQQALVAAYNDLVDMNAPIIAMDETLFVDTLPKRVIDSPTRVGEELDGPVMTLADGSTVATAIIDLGQASFVKVGDTVTLRADQVSAPEQADAPGEIIGFVRAIASNSPTAGRSTVTIDVEASTDEGVVGSNVQVVFTAATSAPDGFVVPLSAVSTDASGRSRIEIVRGNERQVADVHLGLSDGTMVEIVSSVPALSEDDDVILGTG